VKRLLRMFGTTTFRLALVYTAIFGVSVSGLFGFILVTTDVFAKRQTETAIVAEVAAFQEAFQREGIPGLVQAINRRADPNFGWAGIYLLIDAASNPLAGNIGAWPRVSEENDVWINFKIRDVSKAPEEIADVQAQKFTVPGGYKFLVGRDLREAREFRGQLLRSMYIALALTLALGIIGGVAFSRSIMGRIEAITRTCQQIMSGELSRRVPMTRTSDELGQLTLRINQMLDQIERLMTGMQQVSDNVAHDLRTPLTSLRNQLETALSQTSDGSPQSLSIEKAITAADKLLTTFRSLLRIARTEAGVQGNLEELDIVSIVRDVADLYEPLADEKGLQFETRLSPVQKISGDRQLIAQAFSNLVDNAVKYTQSGGKVTIVAEQDQGLSSFVVADTGPGIPPEYRERVLERMFRLEESRTSPGSGLGLSLVSAVAKSHNLDLKLEDNYPGLRVTLLFGHLSE